MVDKTENSEAKCNRIEKIVETDKHIFIYISSLAAFIIPARIFSNAEEKGCFLSKLESFKKVC